MRIHGILTRGGDAVSAIPSNVTLEWRVRAGNRDAIVANSAKVDRCFKAGAMAVGAKVTITNIAGYMPMRNNKSLQDMYVANARDVAGENNVVIRPDTYNGGGSTDMGDLAQIMPLIHPYSGGATGIGHGKDYVILDYDTAGGDADQGAGVRCPPYHRGRSGG